MNFIWLSIRWMGVSGNLGLTTIFECCNAILVEFHSSKFKNPSKTTGSGSRNRTGARSHFGIPFWNNCIREVSEFMKRNTLYILDDSELDLAILNEIFKRDFQVTCFSSANLLLSALREQHQQVCAILLDVCLNRRNEGLSILRRLQEHPNFSNIPIILIASDANRENVMDGIELGAIDFLEKPVNPHYVRERVLNTVAAVWNEAPPEQSKKDSSVEANSEKPTHLPPLFEEETPYALSSSGPIGSTGPFFLLPEDIESISSGWIKRLVMLCQYRPSLSLGQVRNIQELTALLAKQYVMDHPNGALTEVDAKMIGVAATFYDIGLIGIPDDILRGWYSSAQVKKSI